MYKWILAKQNMSNWNGIEFLKQERLCHPSSRSSSILSCTRPTDIFTDMTVLRFNHFLLLNPEYIEIELFRKNEMGPTIHFERKKTSLAILCFQTSRK